MLFGWFSAKLCFFPNTGLRLRQTLSFKRGLYGLEAEK